MPVHMWRQLFVPAMASRLGLLRHVSPAATLIAVHVRVGDSCTSADQRPECMLDWATQLRKEIVHKKSQLGAMAGNATGMAMVANRLPRDAYNATFNLLVVLLSTDSGVVFSRRSASAAKAGVHAVLGLHLNRAVYSSTDLIEHRVKKGELEARRVLADSLLDIILLAHGRHHVGSFYSNFARLALLMSGSLDSTTRDGSLWCPFHKCNVGRHDLCNSGTNVLGVASADLGAGGPFATLRPGESGLDGGCAAAKLRSTFPKLPLQHPLRGFLSPAAWANGTRCSPHDPPKHGRVSDVHPARRAWVTLMDTITVSTRQNFSALNVTSWRDKLNVMQEVCMKASLAAAHDLHSTMATTY